jgi:hypothetical protein
MSDSEDDGDRKGGKSTKKSTSSKQAKAPSEQGKKPKKPKNSQAPKEITGKTPEEIAEDEESKRLKKTAIQIGLIAKRSERSKHALRPSSTIRKHTQLKPVEIVKKAVSRKNKALLLFPGLVAVLKEGKMGQLSNMQKNPILDIEFPTGTLKLKGTRINSKQKFISIQPKVFQKISIFDGHIRMSMILPSGSETGAARRFRPARRVHGAGMDGAGRGPPRPARPAGGPAGARQVRI